ncbi:hypothetical protein [Variovorax sp. KK3]|uniref:hypothetical protein n=1 Tax=Variovorax sp. KK3 TaxID=1855728 RepID=UPI00097CB14A|nr:hypothetical protein [Variovorax sp. KK3]
MDDDREVKRFGYEGWDIRICLDGPVAGDGQLSAQAELSLAGAGKCRISLSGRIDIDTACDTLERKAKAWVDDWKSREHSGGTHFAEL